MKKLKKKYLYGTQELQPDYTDLERNAANKRAQQSSIRSVSQEAAAAYAESKRPGSGGEVKATDQAWGLVADNTTDTKGAYKNGLAQGASYTSKLLGHDWVNLSTDIVQDIGGRQQRLRRDQRNANARARLNTFNSTLTPQTDKSTLPYLAKKGLKKVGTNREIEFEGPEAVLSPKGKDGKRKLIHKPIKGKTHAEGGIKAVVTSKYGNGVSNLQTTTLSSSQESAYKGWLKKGDHKETEDYDMRGYWKEEGFKNLSPSGGHYPDTYKRLAPFTEGDNYMQLSDESKYANKFDKRRQGQWIDDKFTPYKEGTRKLSKGSKMLKKC